MRRAWVISALALLFMSCSRTPQNSPLATTTSASSATTIDMGPFPPASTSTPAPAPISSFPQRSDSPTPTSIPSPSPTLTRLPSTSIRLLSYNLLYGAGVERQFDSALPSHLVGVSRLPALLSYVKVANPDLWGIEEANGWDQGTPAVIDQVAQQLGMHAILAKTPGGFHLGLLTKFDIVESEDLSAQVGRQGALHALLRAPDGKELNVFLVHLDPNSQDARRCEVDTLVRKMQPYQASRAILIGDMNFTPATPEYWQLEQAGWKPVAVEKTLGIDQIWIAPSVEWSTTTWFESLPLPDGISDHLPIGAEIALYSTTQTVSTPPRLPATPTVQIPSWLSTRFAGASVAQHDGFEGSCSTARWTSRWKTERIANGRLEITGEAPWQASVSRYRQFFPGEGVVLRFQFTRGSEFEISFDSGPWDTERYRRFGLYLREDAAQAVLWQGTAAARGENLKGNLYPQPDTWYDLLLALSKQGEFIVQVRDPGTSSQVLEYRERTSDPEAELPWTFRIGVDKGKLSLDDITELSLER